MSPPPALVDHAMVGDDEDPGAEARLVPIESPKAANDLDEDVTEQIFGLARAL